MCGRYTLSESPEWSELHIRVPEGLDLRPRYNAAPGQVQLVVRRAEVRELTLHEQPWGALARGKRAINARAESLSWPCWRDHLARVVVPADGYVEWQAQLRGKQPFHLQRLHRDGRAGLLYMAGLLLEDGFVIVTTPPSRDLEILHDRMPAILPPKQVGAWLDAPWPAARSLLRPAPEGLLSATPLTSRINSPAHDDPACLTPLCPEPQGLAGGPMGGGAAPRP